MKKTQRKQPHLIFFSIFCLLLASCGYFSDEPVQDVEVFENGEMTTACSLETDKFELILEQDVSFQIKCLEAHFRDFIKYVRVENREYVTEHELGTFITRFFHQNSGHIIKSLKFLFELNMILLNDNRDQISTGNIAPLFKLMIEANFSAIKITGTLNEIDNTNYWDKRQRLEKSFEDLAAKILGIINVRDTRPLKINIKDFLMNLRDRFEDITLTEEMIDNGLFVKKLFLGGEKEELTTSEVRQLLVKAPKLVMLAIDFFFVSEKSFRNSEDLYGFYAKLIGDLAELFHPLDEETPLCDTEHMLNLVAEVSGEDFDRPKYEKLITSYKVNLLGGDKDNFTFKNLRESMHLLKGFMYGLRFQNVYAKSTMDLEDMDLEDRRKLNKELFAKLLEFQNELKPLIVNNTLVPERMNVLNFISDLSEKPELMKSLFAVKTLLVGGSLEKLTREELERLHGKLDELGKIGFNIQLIPFSMIENQEEKLGFFRKNILSLRKILIEMNPGTKVFTSNDILVILDSFLKPPLEAKKFKPTLENVKARILGGHKSSWTKADVDKLLLLAQSALDKAYFYEVSYRGHGVEMNQPGGIDALPFLDMPEYDSFTSTQARSLHNNYIYQARTFRYFRDDQGLAYYNGDIKRNAKGFTENGLIRFAFDKFLKGYGEKKAGVWGIELNQIKLLLNDFRPVLEEFNLWTLNFENYVQNVLLLGDLFQSVSNGTMRLELDEATEFGGLVLQTMIMSEAFLVELKKIHDSGEDRRDGNDCSYKDEKNLTFSVLKCHRPYFFDIFFNRLGYRKNYPKFAKYHDGAGKQELFDFIANIEGFSRDFDDTSIPMASRDYGLFVGAMINIESTFIRFDADNDNLLDTSELEKAFSVYRDAVIKVAKLSEGKEKYAKSIFFYMVKYKKIPSTFQLLNFHYGPWSNHEVKAKRENIGALLYYLVNQ